MFALVTLALIIEIAIGYPAALFAAIGHPVTWWGALIGGLDDQWNRDGDDPSRRRAAGVLALAVLLVAAGGGAIVLTGAIQFLVGPAVGLAVIAVIASSLIAQRSLDQHVAAVATALDRDGLAAGRIAVAQIVGRDPNTLDQAGVARAAIESLAENFADGVVAPAFWLAVGGLPGAAIYKAINTADSMIGHKSPRHLAFGWASARLDDLVNLPASRLTALWLVVAAATLPDASARMAWQAVWRDARHHRSPNAGWPEAAMAGALGLKLAGPRVYGGIVVDDHWMGDGRAEAEAADIRRALALYRRALILQIVVYAVLAVLA